MKKSLFTVTIAALCAAAPAMAGETYVSLDVGQTSVSNCTGCTKPTSVRVGVGYQYTPNWAIETSYAALGNSTDAKGLTAKLQAIQVAAVGSFPVANALSLTGKVGVAAAMLDVTGGVGNTNVNLAFGIGAQYAVSKQFSVRVQYENLGRFGNASNTTASMNGSLVSAGVVMNF